MHRLRAGVPTPGHAMGSLTRYSEARQHQHRLEGPLPRGGLGRDRQVRTRLHELPHDPDIPACRLGYLDSYTVSRLMRCTKCGLWKAPDEFPNSRTRQFSYCRECRRAYDRRYYHERGKAARSIRKRARAKEARAWMNALKEGVPCCDCGRLFPVWVMHWDHLPGYEKLGCISEMVGNRSRNITIAELNKCELVCANCHVLRTTRRAGRGSAT